MLWMGHVARIGERRGAYNVLMRKLQGKRPSGNPRVDWSKILK
jgi:hypothetical protein